MEMKKADVAVVSPAISSPSRRNSSGPRTYNQLSKLHHFFGDNVPLTDPEAKQVAKVNKIFGEDFPSKFFESHQQHRKFRRSSTLPSYFKHAASYPERSHATPDDIDSGFDGDYNSDDEMGMSVNGKKASHDKSTKPALISHQRKRNSESNRDKFVKKVICPESATFEEMVDFFINPRIAFDSGELDAFILCLPSFSNPLSLMSVLRKRFQTSQDSTDIFVKKEKILEMRLRQIKILEFLNDWLRSVNGMEDLRRCPKLQQNVRTFLEEKDCDLVSFFFKTVLSYNHDKTVDVRLTQ